MTLGYTESRGLPALRAEIANTYSGVSADDVLCCVPQEGVTLLHALLRPGDRVVATAPGYQSLHSLAESLDCHVSLWQPRRATDGRLHFDVADLRRLAAPGAACITVNFPHNPTGCCPTPAEWADIVDIACQQGAILFSDEVYRPLWSAGPPCVSAASLYDKAVVLGALSKSHSLPGLRAGWLVARDAALMAKLCAAKDYTTICGSAPSEVLALIGLRASDVILAKNRALIVDNLAAASRFFEAWSHVFEWSPPKGGTVGFPRLLTGETAADFCMRALSGCGVLLLPSSAYDHTVPGEERFRIGFGRRNFPSVLAIFEKWLQDTMPPA